MDDLYREQIIDHYKNPRNFGPPPLKLRKGERVVAVKEANASCGDLFEISLRLQKPKAKSQKPKAIAAVRFRGVGCAISTAAFSLLTEKIKQLKAVNKIEKLNQKDMLEMLAINLSPTRIKCATLPLRALKKALRLGDSE